MSRSASAPTVGRPSKFTPEREQAILAALRVGNTRTAAVHAAEISLDTLARWIAANEDFRGAVEKAEADAEQRFLAQVAVAAKTTWQAAAWWLERRRALDYRRQDGVDLSGRVEHVSVTDGLSAEEKRELRERLARSVRGESDADANVEALVRTGEGVDT